MNQSILVTGGAGFIGSNFVLDWVDECQTAVINLDKLTYAGNRYNLTTLDGDDRHIFIHGDICDSACVSAALGTHRPRAVVNFAAETHVDRSIVGPQAFIQTNVIGTFTLLECTRQYLRGLSPQERQQFRFLHVSTDEVYGSLGPDDCAFTEGTKYAPNSPYSAAKASSDHLVRSYHHTYGIPTLTTNCSNNYGPYQFPEKLIPLVILNALSGKQLPIYGDGLNVRDWLYVKDHCDAIRQVLANGRVGETYNIGGNSEQTNVAVVHGICDLLDELQPSCAVPGYRSLITFVQDRPGHDRRYAVDTTKIANELGWRPKESFADGLRRTVRWYLDNMSWVDQVRSGAYRHWMDLNYKNRGALCEA
ncbi:MAG TPA: dTDP-glucose 4,6-dehydratase [Terriglobales bacterium]|nr:dTDP-glucose 4,6-dehydratase [Terriglobales bacterium]